MRLKRQVAVHRLASFVGVAFLTLGFMGVPLAWGQGAPPLPQAVPESTSTQDSAGLVSDETVIAILPFEINSARPLKHLVDALPSLLSAKLEATGKIAVVEQSQVAEALPESGVVALSDSKLRDLAVKLNASGVVLASVTELAGRFSLDVRFTPADPGMRSRSLAYTAASEKALIAQLGKVSEQVVAAVSGDEADRIIGVEVLGAGNLEPKFRSLLKSLAGTEYEPDQVEADRKLLSTQERVAQVTVDTERRSGGIVLSFTVVRTEAIGAGAVAETVRSGEVVSEVRIRGNRRIESDAIRSRIQTRAGDPLNRAKVAGDVREIQSLGFFQDVWVYSTNTPEGVRLTFEVKENPVIRQISITGNESLDTDKVEEVLTLTTGSTLDYPLLHENDERITQLYKQQGFYLAKVKFKISPEKDGAVSIDFDVKEGKKLKLRDVEFVGNEAFSDKELKAKFQTKTWKWYSHATSWLDKTGTYSEPIFMRDRHEVETMYMDNGYLQVDIGEPEIDAKEEGLYVRLTINEGPQFHVGAIDVVGDSTMDLSALREKVMLDDGDVFNRSYLTQDVEILERHYTDRGFFLASVRPQTRLSQEDRTVDVEFVVEKGPLYFVRNVNISGNTRTIDPVIRREMKVVEGQLYSARGVRLSSSRIRRLGFFEDVAFESEPTDDPSQLDMDVRVVERPTGSFSFGAGYSSQDGLVGTASLAQSNLFGRGYAVNLSVDIGSRTDRYVASISDPYFMGTTFSLSGSIYITDMNYESFRMNQKGISLYIGHSLAEDNSATGSLSYSWRSRSVEQVFGRNAAAPIYRQEYNGNESASIIGLSFNRDTRDDRFSATRGTNFGATVQYAGAGGFSKFLRFEAQGAWYMGAPSWMIDRSSFVLSGRVGYAIPFNEISDWDLAVDQTSLCSAPGSCNDQIARLDQIDTDLKLPLTERYFIGGIGPFQLRGYRARSVGPRRAILRRTDFEEGALFHPLGTRAEYDPTNDQYFAVCEDNGTNFGNGNGKCNQLNTQNEADFEDIFETDVVGGNSFISTSFEYRFAISEAVGLQGVVFVDGGNAFYEGQNLFDVTEWRYGYGGGVLWFSPFGPLQLVLGFPVSPKSYEESPVFEFSVGGFGL